MQDLTDMADRRPSIAGALVERCLDIALLHGDDVRVRERKRYRLRLGSRPKTIGATEQAQAAPNCAHSHALQPRLPADPRGDRPPLLRPANDTDPRAARKGVEVNPQSSRVCESARSCTLASGHVPFPSRGGAELALESGL